MTPHFCPDPNRDPDGNRNRQETVQTTEQTANNLERTGAESSRKQQTVARITAHNPEVAGSSPVSATRQRTLKPQRFQGSFCAIWAGVFPLFFPLQVFKGDFQGVQPPRRRAVQDARAAANPTALSDFQRPGKGTKRQAPADLRSPRQTPKFAGSCESSQHPGNPKFSLPFSPGPGNVRGAPG